MFILISAIFFPIFMAGEASGVWFMSPNAEKNCEFSSDLN